MLREMPNLVERDIYLQRVAEELGVSEGLSGGSCSGSSKVRE